MAGCSTSARVPSRISEGQRLVRKTKKGPDRSGPFALCPFARLERGNEDLVDAVAVEVDDFEMPVVAIETFARHRQVVEGGEDIAGHGFIACILGHVDL